MLESYSAVESSSSRPALALTILLSNISQMQVKKTSPVHLGQSMRYFFTDCDGFNFASMMRLVEARRLATQREELLGPKIGLLEKLSVRGQSPRLTEEQI